MSSVAAIDLGATSGRVMLGSIESGRLVVHEVARFPNTPVRVGDGLHWDVLALYSAAMQGLAAAARRDEKLLGAAIDSWAVDYALLAGNRMLGNPFHYRDERTALGVRTVHERIGAAELFARNGLAHQPFTTMFQLAAEPVDILAGAGTMLLIPDLLGYWATGAMVAERTNASTTGLLPVGEKNWDSDLGTRLSLPSGLLPELVDPGQRIGALGVEVREEFGIDRELLLTTVGSHDTASAVVAVPATGEDIAYISSGTWSLVGTELAAPVTTAAARAAGFTNEGGVDGRIRFLRNVMGLWLLSESMRWWEKTGTPQDLDDLLAQAGDAPADGPTFDAQDPRLLAPGDLPGRIAALLTEAGSPVPRTPGELVRCIVASLALAHGEAVRDIERLTGRRVGTVHIVGGGARNALLCQLTADAVGVPVLAGPVEATAIGNLLIQARTHGLITGDLSALRRVVAHSFPPRTYAAGTRMTRKG